MKTDYDGIRIEVEKRPSGMLFATSPDMRGLFVAGRSEEELEAEIPLCIRLSREARETRSTDLIAL